MAGHAIRKIPGFRFSGLEWWPKMSHFKVAGLGLFRTLIVEAQLGVASRVSVCCDRGNAQRVPALRFSAKCWARPSIVEMSADTVACGRQCTALGTEKGVAEQSFRAKSQQARPGIGLPYTRGSGRTTSTLWNSQSCPGYDGFSRTQFFHHYWQAKGEKLFNIAQ